MTYLPAESVESFEKSIFVCDDIIQIFIFPASQSGWQGAYKHTIQQRRATDQQTFLCYTFSEYRSYSDISKLFRDSSCTSACLALLSLYVLYLCTCSTAIVVLAEMSN